MKRFLITLGLFGALLTGCGADSDSGRTPGDSGPSPQQEAAPPLTKAEFIVKADAMCRGASNALDNLEKESQTASDANDYEALAKAYLDLADAGDELASNLEAAGYDGQDSKVVDEYIRTTEKQAAKVRGLTAALRDVDFGKITSLGSEINALSGKAEGLATGFGMKGCAFKTDATG